MALAAVCADGQAPQPSTPSTPCSETANSNTFLGITTVRLWPGDAPEAKGVGVGYELLRLSIAGLRQRGAKRVSLTVTATNEGAVRLYLKCGFREVRRFYAYVWEVSG